MRIVRILELTCVAVAMVAAHTACAQDTILHIHRVGDTLSIRNAPVTIDHTIEAGKTDSAGMLRVSGLEDGGHVVEATADGYMYMFDTFFSGPDVKGPVELVMYPDKTPNAGKAKGQVTDLHFADFDRRRAKGSGTFFTRAQLDSASGRPIANLLVANAGASTVSEHSDEFLVASGPKPEGAKPCYSAVVRDGLRIYPFENATPPDLGKIFAEDFAGVEFYGQPATVPAELHDAATCGALVLWSRSGGR